MSLLPGNFVQTMNRWPAKIRVLLFIITMVAIFFAWKSFLWDRVQYKKIALSNQTKSTYNEMRVLENGLKEAQATLLKTGREPKQIVQTNTHNRLVPAKEITKVLEDLLFARHDLELLQLQNLPVKAIPGGKSNLMVYEYGVVIKFKGNYFATLRYLYDLENLNWAFFWDKLTYQVTKYPYAEVILQLHTLSDQKGWIHV